MLRDLIDSVTGLGGVLSRMPGHLGGWWRRETSLCRHNFRYSMRASAKHGTAWQVCRCCGVSRRHP